MFWKKSKKAADPLMSWQLLRWTRSPQEYIPWIEISGVQSFQPHFENDHSSLVYFDREWSVISTLPELERVLSLLEERALREVSSWKPKGSAKPYLLLKQTSMEDEVILIQPCLQFESTSPLPFLGPKEQFLDFSLTIRFFDQNSAQTALDAKRQSWLDRIDAEHIDQFVTAQINQLVKRHFAALRKNNTFDSLRNILIYFDTKILSSESKTSTHYLKEIWTIPFFVFADQPEEAALAHLRLKKSFKKVRARLYTQIAEQYRAQLLGWTLYHQFSQAEWELIQKSSQAEKSTALNQQELHTLYTQILERSGVPVEIGELYGNEVFFQRVLEIVMKFSQPKEKVLADVPNKSLYVNLISVTTNYLYKHSRVARVTAEELLSILLKVVSFRLEEVKHLTSLSEKELQESLQAEL